MSKVSERKKPSRTAGEGQNIEKVDGPEGLKRLADLVKRVLSVPKSALTDARGKPK